MLKMTCFDVKVNSTTGKTERGATLRNKPSFTTFLREARNLLALSVVCQRQKIAQPSAKLREFEVNPSHNLPQPATDAFIHFSRVQCKLKIFRQFTFICGCSRVPVMLMGKYVPAPCCVKMRSRGIVSHCGAPGSISETRASSRTSPTKLSCWSCSP